MKLIIMRKHLAGMEWGTRCYRWHILIRGSKFAQGFGYTNKQSFKRNLKKFIGILDPKQEGLDLSEAFEFLGIKPTKTNSKE